LITRFSPRLQGEPATFLFPPLLPLCEAGTLTISGAVSWTSDNSLTINANSAIAINANVTNTSNAASITFNSGTTASSSLTVGAGVTVSLTGSGVSPTGTLTLSSNTIATSDMTLNGTISATDKALTLNVADVFSLSGTGSVAFNSPGKTFTYNKTAATGTTTFTGGVTITDGSSSFTSPGGAFNINGALSTSGTGTMTISSGGTVTFGTGQTVSYGSSGNLSVTTTVAGSDININSTTFGVTAANASFLPIDDFTLSAASTFNYSAPLPQTLLFGAGTTTQQTFT
jgi:hypothetical protein